MTPTPTPTTHINWPPLPEHDVEEWSESGITLRYVGWSEEKVLAYAEFFCTEQATEIAALKARVAELMPLAKLGAMIARKHLGAGGGKLILPAFDSRISEQIYDDVFAPNIEATITKLLKD